MAKTNNEMEDKVHFLVKLNSLWRERISYLDKKRKDFKKCGESQKEHICSREMMDCDYVLGKVLEIIRCSSYKSEILSLKRLTKKRANELLS